MRMIVTATAALSMALAGTASASRLVLIERAVSDKTIDLGTSGDSLGDLLVFANPVFDATNHTQLGSDQGYCVRVIVGKSWECFWTLSLKDGQITSEGPFYDQSDSVMVVTGGTGKYAGAKGSLQLHARDAKGSAYDFAYELL
jgi:allene oxide cyclase